MARAKVQLCGKLVVELDGERVEERLPGRQGRVLFAFLVANRNRTLTRDDLLDALWADGRDRGLAPLLSKLRRIVRLDGARVVLPEGAWIDEVRRRLGELHLRALEAYAQAGLGIRGTELAAAVRAGRELTRREPYRETGYRLLMEALSREGNPAEALLAYDDLRTRLHADLGVSPGPQTQELHKRLLRGQ